MEETSIGDEEFQEYRSKEIEWVAHLKGIFDERKTELWMSNYQNFMGTGVVC